MGHLAKDDFLCYIRRPIPGVAPLPVVRNKYLTCDSEHHLCIDGGLNCTEIVEYSKNSAMSLNIFLRTYKFFIYSSVVLISFTFFHLGILTNTFITAEYF